MNSFFALLFRQKYITRWGLMRNTVPESLSEHTAECAAIAHSLAIIGNTLYGKHYDADHIAALALYHDAPEVLTGDLPTPVKYFNRRTKADYDEIEEDAIKSLLQKLPVELRPAYEALLCGTGNEEEHKLVKIADRLCAYIKCLSEEEGGNREFISAKKAIGSALDAIDSPELDYFMAHFIPAFKKTLDEL